MTDTITRHEYGTEVRGKKIVTAYRAFAEDTQPWVVYVSALPGTPSITFEPTLPSDYFTKEEAEEFDRAHVSKWVDLLTDLIGKAYPLVEVVKPHLARVVDQLGEGERDAQWIGGNNGHLYESIAGTWWERTNREWVKSLDVPHWNAPYTEVLV